ncbi:MAG TPA: LLM class flavin-dependent oxidoreductase [Cellulomonas sp.]
MLRIPLGIHLGERFTLDETLHLARFADQTGFDSVWVAEGRLTRDAVSLMALIAQATDRVRIGSGVVNNKSRNAALMAVTFKTLDEIAPGRIILGLGAWWEPLASKVGAPLDRPLGTMREYIEVCRRFFRNEEVTFDGRFVQMDAVRFDRMYAENRPVPVSIYTGPVGLKMVELSGEVADGVYLDFLLPTSYLDDAIPAIERGLAARTQPPETPFDITQIVACSVDNTDPDAAVDHCRAFLTLYLMQQPHIARYCGVEPELVARIQEVAGWPARPDHVKEAMKLVPTSLVRRVSACGTTAQAVETLEAYHDAGVRVPVLGPLGDRKSDTVKAIAGALL